MNNTTRRALQFDASLRIIEREDGGASRTIEGYAVRFNEPSLPLWAEAGREIREIIDPSAIDMTLLESSDIMMTLFHDDQQLLARSDHGSGNLTYWVDDSGVGFRFDAPQTVDGDKALELVRLGVIRGCSFAFTCPYNSKEHVKREGDVMRVLKINEIFDFTLTPRPAYPSTECSAREMCEEPHEDNTVAISRQLSDMARRADTDMQIFGQEN